LSFRALTQACHSERPPGTRYAAERPNSINLVSDIALGSPADRAKDILGRVYEYFLAQFASAEGKKGGQFYTPSRVVRVLVEVLAPCKGRVHRAQRAFDYPTLLAYNFNCTPLGHIATDGIY
jgi:hypothetical protein